MSDRYDLPRIKPAEQPTIFNHEAGKWGYLSSIAASIATLPMTWKESERLNAKMARDLKTTKSLQHAFENATKEALSNPVYRTAGFIALGAGLVGAAIGGSKEKEKQEREGRVVDTPSYWNKGIVTGMFASSVIGGIFTYALKKPLGLGVSLVMGIGLPTLGSIHRYNELQQDYTQALQLKQQQQQHMQQQQLEREQLIQKLMAQQAARASAAAQTPVIVKQEVPASENKQDAILANQAAPSIDAATATNTGTVSIADEQKLTV